MCWKEDFVLFDSQTMNLSKFSDPSFIHSFLEPDKLIMLYSFNNIRFVKFHLPDRHLNNSMPSKTYRGA